MQRGAGGTSQKTPSHRSETSELAELEVEPELEVEVSRDPEANPESELDDSLPELAVIEVLVDVLPEVEVEVAFPADPSAEADIVSPSPVVVPSPLEYDVRPSPGSTVPLVAAEPSPRVELSFPVSPASVDPSLKEASPAEASSEQPLGPDARTAGAANSLTRRLFVSMFDRVFSQVITLPAECKARAARKTVIFVAGGVRS